MPLGLSLSPRKALLALALLLPSLSACLVSTPTPNLAGQDVAMTFVHTADIHSRVFPYFFAPGTIDEGLGLVAPAGQISAVVGGAPRVSTLAQCIRGLMTGPLCDQVRDLVGPVAERSLHVDSGDIFEGAPVFNVFQGELETRAETQMGVSAMALGNHEFDKGSANVYAQLANFAGFPVLAANYDFLDPNNPAQPNKLGFLVPPYSIFNVGGLKVGVVGMGNISSMTGLVEGGNSLGILPIDSVNALTPIIQVLRPQVDLLVVVSHLGLDEDQDVSASDSTADDQNQAIALDGIDVIFGGHLHIVLNPPHELLHIDSNGMETGKTIECHSGAFAKYVGRLDLVVHVPSADELAQGITGSVKSYTYKIIPVLEDIPQDPEMLKLEEPYQLGMNTVLDLTQNYAVVPCPPNVADCPKVTRTATNGGDSQLGNLVATSMRLTPDVNADFSLTNSLGIRTDFEPGPLDLEQMYNVFPFDNTIATIYLSGIEVQDMMDFVAATAATRGCQSPAQVSGIFMDMQCSTTDTECNTRLGFPSPCAKNIYFGEHCRNTAGTFVGTTCAPLEPYSLYRAAVNDYIANGGSGFQVLERNTSKFNTGINLRDALIDYVQTLPHNCDPASYTNIVGVNCRDQFGALQDCTQTCCDHDAESGTVACCDDAGCGKFQACVQMGMYPQTFDYSNLACLVSGNPLEDAPEGRILPVTAGVQSM
jgi:5'-nucleotidase